MTQMIPQLKHIASNVLRSVTDARRDLMFLDVAGNASVEDPTTQSSRHLYSVPHVVSAANDALKERQGSHSSGEELSPQIFYDVIRVRHGQPLFCRRHMTRLLSSLRLGFLGTCVRTSEDDAWPMWFTRFDVAVKDVVSAQVDPSIEQNVKIIVWDNTRSPVADEAKRDDEDEETKCSRISQRLSVAAFFIASMYPPHSWYEPGNGATVALLFHAHRTNPNAKIVQSELRQRAADQQQQLPCYESLLVHDEADHFKVPEGSRSNYLAVSQEGTVLSSLDEDILVGITLKTLRGQCHLPIVQKPLTLKDVVEARSLVMAGTSPGVLPLKTVIVFSNPIEEAEFQRAMSIEAERPAAAYTALGVHVDLVKEGEHGTPQRVGTLSKDSSRDPAVQRLMEEYWAAAHDE